MQFRRTCACDIDRIMTILADGRASLAALGIDQWQGGYPHRAVIEADVARGESYVVEDGGRIIATAMVGFAGERDYDRIDEGAWLTSCSSDRPTYGVVHRVAVASDGKNRGAATFLLARAEDLARANGSASVRIDTHPGNAPMRGLLEKAGYAQCGVIYIAHAEEGTPERIAYERLV
ncbi:GNAT family N-acetyltransferase [Eggerthella guodeyinii]|uniref:GNAT family N-acetyltransferase n=2 Tax=Eggerthella TaxID=84111 RepID=A0A6L7IQE1_9ACTN|nr:GNAT family N-acetyltransferase [Eggerthella guodeyinii]MBC5582779.1 GNAT family N-acetyltransferase [Eggerthella hominis]QOS69716.1 GNAT family N-acetyltransferase [Eggerthella guodeyinii]